MAPTAAISPGVRSSKPRGRRGVINLVFSVIWQSLEVAVLLADRWRGDNMHQCARPALPAGLMRGGPRDGFRLVEFSNETIAVSGCRFWIDTRGSRCGNA